MAGLDDRKRAFEDKFAHDAELQFKVMARRNRLLGMWAAERLGLADEEAVTYAATVVAADFDEPGEEDVFRKVHIDLGDKASETEIRAAMVTAMTEAQRQYADIV